MFYVLTLVQNGPYYMAHIIWPIWQEQYIIWVKVSDQRLKLKPSRKSKEMVFHPADSNRVKSQIFSYRHIFCGPTDRVPEIMRDDYLNLVNEHFSRFFIRVNRQMTLIKSCLKIASKFWNSKFVMIISARLHMICSISLLLIWNFIRAIKR